MVKRRTKLEPDFLDEIVAETSRKHPEFPELVEAAYERRKLLRALADEREKAGISQTQIAAKMKTSQSAVARLEAGEIDARGSTVDRFAAAVGKRIRWTVVSSESPSSRRTARAAAR